MVDGWTNANLKADVELKRKTLFRLKYQLFEEEAKLDRASYHVRMDRGKNIDMKATILAIKIRTALKCHNLLNFDCSEMTIFQNSHLQKIYQMRPSWFLYLYPFRNESQMKKTFAFCKCGGQFFVCSWKMVHWRIALNVFKKSMS